MYCKYCGNQLPEDAKACQKCGKSFLSGPVDFAPATALKRFADLIIDDACLAILIVLFRFLLSSFTPLGEARNIWWVSIVNIIVVFLYYILFEHYLQRTPGKFATGTKVVMRDGGKAPLRNIIGRTFARHIPFNPLSFLFGAYPVGWHDRISRTVVVPVGYTPEDVKKIDFRHIKEISGNKTLIAVVFILFGLFIVGTLSSIVLVSLNDARLKGEQARSMAAGMNPAAIQASRQPGVILVRRGALAPNLY